jgi:hypothetical protein
VQAATRTCSVLTHLACPRSMARNVHFSKGPCLRLLFVCDCDSPLHIVLPSQCRIVVEDPSVSTALGISSLYHLPHLRPTILGCRGMVQLFVLQPTGFRRERAHTTMGSTTPRPLVDLHYLEAHRFHQEDLRVQAMGIDADQHSIRHHDALHGDIDRFSTHRCSRQCCQAYRQQRHKSILEVCTCFQVRV